MDNLEEQYKSWKQKQTFECMEKSDLKHLLVKELEFLCQMSVQEYTLYRKWKEIQGKYPQKPSNPFFDTGPTVYPKVENVKSWIWTPESPEDYKKLEPVVLWTMKYENMGEPWTILRTFTSTMLNNPNIGRNLRFVVIDNVTGKYLGVLCCSSDFMDLTPRDKYIGWSREIKTTKKMINHTTIGSTIVPTQPLGFSFVGGKLLALLTISRACEDAWNERYNDKLIALTTTSLYGSFSQYQNLKYWNKRGHSAGSIKFEPSKETVMAARMWLKCNHPKRYWEWYEAKNEQGLPLKRDHKQRSLAFIYKELGINKKIIETNHQRGIYFCTLFDNSCEFLRMEIGEDKLVRRFDNNVDTLVKLWKERYASKRIKSLMKNERYGTEGLFYDDMINMTWEETKDKYIGEVGR